MTQKFERPFSGDQKRLDDMMKFICDYWEAHHYSPSIQEIMVGIAVNSTNCISYYRKRLEHEGFLEKVPSPRPNRSMVPVRIFQDRPVLPVRPAMMGLFEHSNMVEFESN